MITKEEEEYLKELYAEKLKREQIKILEKEMWEKVEEAKPDWVKVVKIKNEFRKSINKITV